MPTITSESSTRTPASRLKKAGTSSSGPSNVQSTAETTPAVMERPYLAHFPVAYLKELAHECQLPQTNLQSKDDYVNALKQVERIPSIDGPASEADDDADRGEARPQERQDFERLLSEERERYEDRMDRLLATLQDRREERRGAAPNYARALKDAGFNKLADSDDIDCFLHTFEGIMENVVAPVAEWPMLLCPYLTGEAQLAYFSMEQERRRDYEEVKQTILVRYHLTPESYMDRFHTTIKKKEQTYVDFAAQLERTLRGWQTPPDDLWTLSGYRKLIDGLIVHRLMEVTAHITLKREIRKLSHRPAREVAQQMDDFYAVDLQPSQRPIRDVKPKPRFLDSRPDSYRRPDVKREPTCWTCNKLGHLATACPQRTLAARPNNHAGAGSKEYRIANLYHDEEGPAPEDLTTEDQTAHVSTISLEEEQANPSHFQDEEWDRKIEQFMKQNCPFLRYSDEELSEDQDQYVSTIDMGNPSEDHNSPDDESWFHSVQQWLEQLHAVKKNEVETEEEEDWPLIRPSRFRVPQEEVNLAESAFLWKEEEPCQEGETSKTVGTISMEKEPDDSKPEEDPTASEKSSTTTDGEDSWQATQLLEFDSDDEVKWTTAADTPPSEKSSSDETGEEPLSSPTDTTEAAGPSEPTDQQHSTDQRHPNKPTNKGRTPEETAAGPSTRDPPSQEQHTPPESMPPPPRPSTPTPRKMAREARRAKRRKFNINNIQMTNLKFDLTIIVGLFMLSTNAAVDTGARVNLLPYCLYQQLRKRYGCPNIRQTECRLKTVTNTPIKTLGDVELPVTIQNVTKRVNFSVVPDVKVLILGYPAIRDFQLIMDFGTSSYTFGNSRRQLFPLNERPVDYHPVTQWKTSGTENQEP